LAVEFLTSLFFFIFYASQISLSQIPEGLSVLEREIGIRRNFFSSRRYLRRPGKWSPHTLTHKWGMDTFFWGGIKKSSSRIRSIWSERKKNSVLSRAPAITLCCHARQPWITMSSWYCLFLCYCANCEYAGVGEVNSYLSSKAAPTLFTHPNSQSVQLELKHQL